MSFIGAATEVYDNRPMTVAWDNEADFPTKSEFCAQIKTWICQDKLAEAPAAFVDQFTLYFQDPAEAAR